jgi:ammonium transporter, Amt family
MSAGRRLAMPIAVVRARGGILALGVLGLLAVLWLGAQRAQAALEPTGAGSASIADVPAANPGHPTVDEIALRVGQNKISINLVWTLITGFLVMFMQAGFALVESGLTRAKNASHTMAMNFMIYPLGMLGFYVCGFAFMFGGANAPWADGSTLGIGSTLGAGVSALDSMLHFTIAGKQIDILGWKGFFLGPSVYDVSLYTLFLFQMVFMDTTATIPTGAMAERWKFSAFVVYGCALGTIIYPIYGGWVWGGGWLAKAGTLFGLGHGVVDFAGSSVVHLQGGILALIGAWYIGPRLGKYNKDGTANVMAAHNIPMVVLGTFILAFGWFGFNPGSSLAGTDMRIAMAATNTMLASATGAFATYLWMIGPRRMKPDPSMLCNGMLAGLVAITAPCAFVTSGGAAIIGLVAGVLVVEAVFFFDRKARIDDPVGAISVHGVNGLWGTISVGLFADGSYGAGWNGVPGTVTGLFYGGGVSQLAAQALGAVCCFTYVALSGLATFWVIEKVCGNRVSAQTELEGLDLPEMGVLGYSGVVLDKASETPLPHGTPLPARLSGVPVLAGEVVKGAAL